MAVGFVASATSGSQASVDSFNIGTLGTGARAGIVFVATHGTGDLITGVTWNGVAMTRLYRAADTDTEPGSVVAYFLDNVSNGVITVTRTNNAVVTVGYAASISASAACGVWQTITRAVSAQNTNADTSSTGTGASGEVAVDDGGRPTNSMRFAAFYTGAASPLAAGTNSTSLQSLDSTSFGSRFVRETNAGTGSRSVGAATGTTDDYALVAVVVSEIDVSGTGAISVPAETVAGSGIEEFTGTGSIQANPPTVAGSGAEVFTGTGSIQANAPTVSGSGAEVFTGTGSIIANAPTVAGTGTGGTGEITGTGGIVSAASLIAGSGIEEFTGTGGFGVPAATIAGVGSESIPGSGAVTAAAPLVSGSGTVLTNATGTGAITIPAAVISGVGSGGQTSGRKHRISPVLILEERNDEEEVLLLD